jgi:hypothetical protein
MRHETSTFSCVLPLPTGRISHSCSLGRLTGLAMCIHHARCSRTPTPTRQRCIRDMADINNAGPPRVTWRRRSFSEWWGLAPKLSNTCAAEGRLQICTVLYRILHISRVIFFKHPVNHLDVTASVTASAAQQEYNVGWYPCTALKAATGSSPKRP